MEAFLPLAGSQGMQALRAQKLRPGQILALGPPLQEELLLSPSAVSSVGVRHRIYPGRAPCKGLLSHYICLESSHVSLIKLLNRAGTAGARLSL